MIKAHNPNLKIIRIKAGLFQKEVAKSIGITENAYSIIERGNRPVGIKTAKDICDFLKIQFDDIFEIIE